LTKLNSKLSTSVSGVTLANNHQGMSIVSSRVTEEAIEKLLDQYALPN
jgi:hypothetical protein